MLEVCISTLVVVQVSSAERPAVDPLASALRQGPSRVEPDMVDADPSAPAATAPLARRNQHAKRGVQGRIQTEHRHSQSVAGQADQDVKDPEASEAAIVQADPMFSRPDEPHGRHSLW